MSGLELRTGLHLPTAPTHWSTPAKGQHVGHLFGNDLWSKRSSRRSYTELQNYRIPISRDGLMRDEGERGSEWPGTSDIAEGGRSQTVSPIATRHAFQSQLSTFDFCLLTKMLSQKQVRQLVYSKFIHNLTLQIFLYTIV